MKQVRLLIIPILLACFLVVGCSSDKAWRKAAVDTYEILGISIGATPTITENLKSSGMINDEQLVKVKAVYNKAKAIYAAAGNTLKLASAADTEAKKEAALQDYSKLLTDFNALVVEITNLINSFTVKKISMFDVQGLIEKGGDL
jgi:hypothetical protein